MDGIEEVFYIVLGLASTIFVFVASFHLAGYILKGVALSQMAKNAGLPNPALAWVPVANNYLLGTLCDRAVLAQKWKSRGFAILLPIWDVLGLIFGRNLLAFLSYYDELALHKADPIDLLKSLVALGVLASFAVALWYLYRDYDPERAVLFTVLSVIFGTVIQNVILFIIRNRRPLSAGEFIAPPQRPAPPPQWRPDPPAPSETPDGPAPAMPPFRWKDENKK